MLTGTIVKVFCPNCNAVSSIPLSYVNNEWGIDNVKCSPCFRDRLVFVNLE